MQWLTKILYEPQTRQELITITKELEGVIEQNIPGLTSDTRDRVSQVMFGLALVYSESDMQNLMAKYVEVVQGAVKNDEKWAKEATEAAINSRFRPSYQKAVKAGVDPVDFLRADLGISKEDAEKLAEAFAKEAEK